MNPFKDGLAWEKAGGDQFKGLTKPVAVIKLVAPTFAEHAAHYEAMQPKKTTRK